MWLATGVALGNVCIIDGQVRLYIPCYPLLAFSSAPCSDMAFHRYEQRRRQRSVYVVAMD